MLSNGPKTESLELRIRTNSYKSYICSFNDGSSWTNRKPTTYVSPCSLLKHGASFKLPPPVPATPTLLGGVPFSSDVRADIQTVRPRLDLVQIWTKHSKHGHKEKLVLVTARLDTVEPATRREPVKDMPKC